MGRAPCCSKVGLNRGAWTAEEDQILCDYIKLHGEGNWRNLPKNAGLKRCGKSCRLRWMNYLRPDIKRGNISRDEEELIVRLHKLLGNRWSLIAGRLPGRTDNEIKNYWNTHLSKKVQLPSDSRIKICRVRRPKSSPQQKEQASSAKTPVKTIAVKPQVEPKTVSNGSSAPQKAAAAAEQLDVSLSWQELLICSLPSLESEHAEHLNQDPAAAVPDVDKLLDFNDYCDFSSPCASSPDFDVLSHGLKDDIIIGDAGMDDWIHQLEQPVHVLSFTDSQWEEDASAQPYFAVDVHDC